MVAFAFCSAATYGPLRHLCRSSTGLRWRTVRSSTSLKTPASASRNRPNANGAKITPKGNASNDTTVRKSDTAATSAYAISALHAHDAVSDSGSVAAGGIANVELDDAPVLHP